MKLGVLLFISYFFFLCLVPCGKQLSFIKEDACCSQLPCQSDEDDHNAANNDETGCNPLSSCDCYPMALSLMPAFRISSIAIHEVKCINYCEHIPSTVISSIWQPPKIA